MLKKINIKIDGLHCQSCKTLIETEIKTLPGINKINVDYPAGNCEIEFDDQKINYEEIFKAIEKLNYRVNNDNSGAKAEQKAKFSSKKLITAGILLLIFFAGYLLIKYTGTFQILSKLNEKNLSYGLIFLIGLLVSFHCVGMCGGLVITYTTRHLAQNKDKKNSSFFPHLQYNFGRLISYTLIGAILGGFGSFFGINPTFTGIITLLAAVFMILMGSAMLTNFKWLEKIKLKTPTFIARYIFSERHNQKPRGPFIIGLLNGFMPCGPLQALQLYALASGSIIRGALSMKIYALGTIPLMFGFGSFVSLIGQDRIKKLIKLSGIIVIILGILMFNRGLGNFNFKLNLSSQTTNNQSELSPNNITDNPNNYQTINMELTYQGYVPNVLYIKKDLPVHWVINVEQISGCTSTIMIESLGIRKNLQYGENIIEFTPPADTQEINFSCGMRMVWGKFIITDNNSANQNSPQTPVTQDSCGLDPTNCEPSLIK